MSKTVVQSLAVLLITVGVSGTANAQNQNQGNPTILRAVEGVQQSLDAVASQLTNIITQGSNVTNQLTDITDSLNSIAAQLTALASSVNALGTVPTVVSTSFAYKPAGYSAGCNFQNVGTSSMTVTMELLKIDGVLQQSLPNEVVAAGHGSGFSLAIGSSANHFWCRFTMVSGASRDIRAYLNVAGETTGLSAEVREAR